MINVTRTSLPPFEEYCCEISDLWDNHIMTNMGIKHELLGRELCSYLGADNLVLYANGHLALEAALRSLHLPEGSEIITTPFTFVSTVSAIARCGLVPVFADILPEDCTLDPSCISRLVTPRTAALMPVHVWGNVCDIDAIASEAGRFGLKTIYDAAHAFGVSWNGRSAAMMGDISVFSFHATKVFSTVEGGAVCFRDGTRTRFFMDERNFGIRDAETCCSFGGNAKMSELHAAMGLCNLRHAGAEMESRREAVRLYRQLLDEIPFVRPVLPRPGTVENGSYMSVVFASGRLRDRASEALAAAGYGARKYFYPLVSALECCRELGLDPEHDTPVAHDISARILCLPLFADMSECDIRRVCGTIGNLRG